MTRSWWIRLVGLMVAVGIAVVHVTPTMLNLDTATTKFPFKRKVNLGLDLQGGLYMVMTVDFNRVYKDVMDRQGLGVQDRLKSKSIAIKESKLVTDGVPADDPRIHVTFDAPSRDAVYNLLKAEFSSLRLAGETPGRLEYGIAGEYRNEIREKTVNQSIEVIRNRIDEFGVAEPVITSQGQDRIVVELPGVREIERAKELIGRTAKLEFRMVADDKMDQGRVSSLVAEAEQKNSITFKEGDKFSAYVARINESLKGKLPEGTEIAFERQKNPYGDQKQDIARIPYLLLTKAAITGDDLQDAQVGFNPETRRPEVPFKLNPTGASIFSELTGANVGKRMAIVLDGIVHSAPVINGKIPGGSGVITLGSGGAVEESVREANDLAIVLRAGALPAQLEFSEQRVVGPSLGQDSIAKGAKAGLIGCLLVFIFMIAYYRLSGVIATVSLILNAGFLMAILIGLDATLTLPGIAGIALTIGMAVDSNVIIFERIRDELTEGKSISAAVEAGFQKAFTAIFDANITHGIVAVILMNYGTGPVRGFAVSLLIGIITTLFCALTVCRLMFDAYLVVKGPDADRVGATMSI